MPKRYLKIGLCLVFLVGCKPTSPVTPKVSPTISRPVSLISPVEFFPPEQKRLSQHLGWAVGCFKLEYAGPKAMLTSRLEVWTQGRPEVHGGSSGKVAAETGEVSIAVRDEGSSNYKVTSVLSGGSGSASSSGSYVRPSLGSWSTRVAQLDKPTELKPGEEIPVWALMLFKSNPGIGEAHNPNESIFDQVKRSSWSLVLKVGIEPSKAE
jgi:hypothetical protein